MKKCDTSSFVLLSQKLVWFWTFVFFRDLWLVFSLLTSNSYIQPFLFFPDLVLVNCVILRIYPFLLDCPICWLYSFLTFHVSLVSIVISPLSFLILFISSFSLSFFVSVSPANNAGWILFIFSKNMLLFSLIFSVILLVLFHLFPLLSVLFFPLICSSFSSSFRCKIKLFIWTFSCVWSGPLLL